MGVIECAQVAVPEASELAMRYYHSGNILWIVNQLCSVGIPLLFLITKWSANTSSFAHQVGRKWFFGVVLYLAIFTLFYHIIDFPVDLYSGYFRAHAYGLSTQSLASWFSSYGKGVCVTLANAFLFVWIFYLLVRKSPTRWWIYGSIASIGIVFVTIFVQPIWIDPLFNKFGPMKDKQLEQAILELASKAGIDKARVYEVDKSTETNLVNAYVTGVGSTSRIVLWDTIIDKLTPEQLLFVMGHEMGHYVLHHIWWYLAYFSVMVFALFYFVYWFSHYLLHRYSKVLGFSTLANIASFPLFLIGVAIFMVVTMPVFNAFSRHMEHEADRFGLEITHNNKAAAEGFIALQKENLVNPRPGFLHELWLGSHPSLAERIEFANSYCPWKVNKPERYGKYFKQKSIAISENIN